MSKRPGQTAHMSDLLTPREMDRADALTIAAGTSGAVLLARAGEAVARAVEEGFPAARRIAVLAGPGKNGGDGFVAARRLAEAGRAIDVFALRGEGRGDGEAEEAAVAYTGEVFALDRFVPGAYDLVIDALFGAGLSRTLGDDLVALVRDTRESGVSVLSIDLPSGICGTSGAVLGAAFEAEATVTFFRRKPGHLLQPGRRHCGAVTVADIGISPDVLVDIAPACHANGPALWPQAVASPAADGHKYDRGHAVVFSGGATRTGAARLAAMAALRSGAGLVTLFSPASALLVNAGHLTAVMLRRCENAAELDAALEDVRLRAFVLGPGFGAGEKARDFARTILDTDRALVLDADGITSFADTPDVLFQAIARSRAPTVLTPHGGEFARLFADIAGDGSLSKLEKARAAARLSGAVVVLKGSDTVVADPTGRAVINETGTPWLATAGSGDVLAGIAAGLLSRGMPGFEAAAAAVWMHGKAAEIVGPGLVAEDLPNALPAVLRDLATGPVA